MKTGVVSGVSPALLSRSRFSVSEDGSVWLVPISGGSSSHPSTPASLFDGRLSRSLAR